MTLSEAKTALNQSLTEDIEVFFEEVYSFLEENSKKRDDFMFQQGRYNSLKQQMLKSLISAENAGTTMAHIRYALQETIKELKEKDINPSPTLVSKIVSGGDGGNGANLQRESLRRQEALLQDKLNHFEEELITAIDPSIKFYLTKQIEDIQQKISDIRSKLQSA